MLEAELGVQVTRVHDPEGAVRALRRRAVEVLRREAVRDRDDGPVRETRELRQQPSHGLRCAHHDRGGRSELLAHPRQVAPAVEGARVHHHLVQRPRVAEIGHPRLAEPARELGAGVRGVVGLHPDVDQVDVTGGLRAQLGAALDPPLRPARAEEEPAFRASAPARAPSGSAAAGRRCTSSSGGISATSVSSSGAHRSAVAPPPVTTTGSQPSSCRNRAIRSGRCAPEPPIGGKWYEWKRKRLELISE